MTDDIAIFQHMRRCLLSIRDLDPAGVDVRLLELDAAMSRLRPAAGFDPGERATLLEPRDRDVVRAA